MPAESKEMLEPIFNTARVQLAHKTFVSGNNRGSSSSLFFVSPLNQLITTSTSPSPPVAILKPTNTESAALVQRVNQTRKSLDLLAKYNITRSPFLCPTLYYDSQGIKILPKGSCDLYSFFKKAKKTGMSSTLLKSLIGQMILGLEVLHQANLVHFDFKSRNVICFERDDFVHLQLIDLDGLLQVNSQGQDNENQLRAASFLPPEYKAAKKKLKKAMTEHPTAHTLDSKILEASQATIKKTGQSIRETYQQFAEQDLKKVDCFALGKALLSLCKGQGPHSVITNYICELATGLTHPDPTQRWTLPQAKAALLFGEAPEARTKFFADLQAQATRYAHINLGKNYVLPDHPKENDVFYILPANLQNICTQIELLEDSENIERFRTHLHELQIKIAEALEDRTIKAFYTDLENLKQKLITVWRETSLDFSELTAEQLKTSVTIAVEKYISINKLNTDRLFYFFKDSSGKDSSGKERANAILAETLGAESPQEIVNFLLRFLKDNAEMPGDNHPKNSFKTILAAQLYILSHKPFKQWQVFFNAPAPTPNNLYTSTSFRRVD